MSDGLWMPLYVGDYLRDTGHLTTLEHGAYLLLIMHAWTHDGELPDDDLRLRAIAHLDARDWRRCRDSVRSFFYSASGRLRHKRVDAELQVSRGRQEKASLAGKASAAQRALQRELRSSANLEPTRRQLRSNSEGNSEATQRSTNTTQVESQLKLITPLPRTRTRESKRTFVGLEEHVRVDDTGKRVCNGWYLDDVLAFAQQASGLFSTSADDERTLIKWLVDGYESPAILEAMARVVKRPRNGAIQSFRYFDAAVRQSPPNPIPVQA